MGMDATTSISHRRRRGGRLVTLALTATAGLALLPGTPSRAATTDATISGFRFSPDPLPVPIGATVKWTNDDGTTHTVTADDGSFDSGDISPRGTFTQTFAGPARTITYHCNIHSSMHGTLQIGGGTTPTTAAPTTTTTATPATTTTAPPTTTTTVRATSTTTAPLPTTAPAAKATTTTRPAAASTTRATAAPPSTAPLAPVPPAPAAAPPVTGAAAPPTAPAPVTDEAAPPAQAANGVTVPPAPHDGTGRGGPAVAAGVAALALLAGAGTWFARRRLRAS
jgi:plastocyanin